MTFLKTFSAVALALALSIVPVTAKARADKADRPDRGSRSDRPSTDRPTREAKEIGRIDIGKDTSIKAEGVSEARSRDLPQGDKGARIVIEKRF